MTAPPGVRVPRPADRSFHPSAHALPPWPTKSTTGPVDVIDLDAPTSHPSPDEKAAARIAPDTFPPGAGRGAVSGSDTALIDLVDVFAVYPFRRDMPVCEHCVFESDLHAIGYAPGRIPPAVLDKYVAKALITWGDETDFKRLLPEIFTRLDRGDLGVPDTLVGARLRRADWTRWPAAEAPAVRGVLRSTWVSTLALVPEAGRVSIVSRLGLIATAEDDLAPYLDLWEDRLVSPGDPGARLAATLHLAELLAPLATAGRRRLMRGFPLARRSVVGQIDHWLRQPGVVQRLARGTDALAATPYGPRMARARDGLARLRADG